MVKNLDLVGVSGMPSSSVYLVQGSSQHLVPRLQKQIQDP
jgi:hypothetical protein